MKNIEAYDIEIEVSYFFLIVNKKFKINIKAYLNCEYIFNNKNTFSYFFNIYIEEKKLC